MMAPDSLGPGKHDRRPGAAKSRSEPGREKCPSLLAPSNLSNLSAHFRQILIMGGGSPLRSAGGGAVFFFSVFLFNWIFGWTPWTGWTASAKSGTSCVQPKIRSLDTLDRLNLLPPPV